MQFVLQEAFRARKAYCGYLIWPISLWRSLNSPLRISCSWEREYLKKVFHCNQRWLKAFWQCRQKFLFRAAAGWVVREEGLEGARGFQEMGMRMLGSVRRTPVGKHEISKLLETTSVKQAQEISQTTIEKIWRFIFWKVCVSGGGHRARQFKTEALQAGDGEEKSRIPEREWKWWNVWERSEWRVGGIWETWVVWGNCHYKYRSSPDQTLSPLHFQLLYFRGERAPQPEPQLNPWGKKYPLTCAVPICPTFHQRTNTNGWEEGYRQARVLRGTHLGNSPFCCQE